MIDEGTKYENRYKAIIDIANDALFNLDELQTWTKSHKHPFDFTRIHNRENCTISDERVYPAFESLSWLMALDYSLLNNAPNLAAPYEVTLDRLLLCAVFDGELNLYDKNAIKIDVEGARRRYNQQPEKILVGKVQISRAPAPISPLRGTSISMRQAENKVNAPNWKEWKYTPSVRLWEACALSLNIDPHNLKDSGHGWMGDSNETPSFKPTSFPNSELETEFYLRVRLLVANFSDRKYFQPSKLNMAAIWQCSVKLSDFAHWASSIVKWKGLPPELVVLDTKNAQESDKNKVKENIHKDEAPFEPASTVNETTKDDKLWNIKKEGDPEPEQDWYTPARYFARNLVKKDPSLLTKRAQLAKKIAQLLPTVNVMKRGGKKPLADTTILKALTNITFD